VRLCIEKGLKSEPTTGFFTVTVPRCTGHSPSSKQFLAQKSITEMEYPSYSLDLALDDFWIFPKLKSALKGRRFQDIEDIQKM
jgi:hypothetical protein